jgi:hypothetical protein
MDALSEDNTIKNNTISNCRIEREKRRRQEEQKLFSEVRE